MDGTQPTAPLPQSKLGIASFVIPFVLLGLFVVAIVLGSSRPGRPGTLESVIGAWLLVGQPIGFLVGLVLGIVALCRKGRRRGLAIAGVAINGVFGLVGTLLMIAALGSIGAH